MVNELQKEKEKEVQIWGRLGKEAGYSQAAPVAFWKYKLLAMIPRKTKHAA